MKGVVGCRSRHVMLYSQVLVYFSNHISSLVLARMKSTSQFFVGRKSPYRSIPALPTQTKRNARYIPDSHVKLETLRLLRRTVPRREGADPVSANWEGSVEDLQESTLESTLESTVTRVRDQTSIFFFFF